MFLNSSMRKEKHYVLSKFVLFKMSSDHYLSVSCSELQQERQQYEVVVESGKLVFRQTGALVHSSDDSKWIFVLSTTKAFYVGQVDKKILLTILKSIVPIHMTFIQRSLQFSALVLKFSCLL
jgi:hypothetical protein